MHIIKIFSKDELLVNFIVFTKINHKKSTFLQDLGKDVLAWRDSMGKISGIPF